jgi:signal transduction histidine kinase
MLAAVIAIISAVAYYDQHESMLRNADGTLRVMSASVATELDEPWTPGQLHEQMRSILGTRRGQWLAPCRVWLDGSASDLLLSHEPNSPMGRWLRQLPAERPPALNGSVCFFAAPAGEKYRFLWSRRAMKRGQTNLVVGMSWSYARHEMWEFLRMLLILGGCITVISEIAVTLIVFRASRPLKLVAHRLAGITHANLAAEDLSDVDAPAELRPFLAALRQMLLRLDKVFQQQRRFTADAAHELRTPLALAKSTLQAARLTRGGGQIGEQAEKEVVGDLDRMERLVNQLLDLSKLDEDGKAPRDEVVALHDLLSRLAVEYEPLAAATGGRVVAGAGPATLVRGSEAELSRLFGNLLDNALKHGPEGGTVTVSLGVEDGRCAVAVHDEGGKIVAEDLPRLFDRFYRADKSRARSTGGTGLGLAIAREIARRHGGEIEVASGSREGTTFTVRLPLPGGAQPD